MTGDNYLWNFYFAGNYTYANNNQASYYNKKILCSHTEFNGATSSVAVLTGSTQAIFNSVVFQSCPMSGSTNLIECKSDGLVLLKSYACKCSSSGSGRLVYYDVSSRSDFFLDTCSITSCGDIEKDWRCVGVNGGMIDTCDNNLSYCKGSKYTTIEIDYTHRGSYFRRLHVVSNEGLNCIITFEDPYNIIRSSLMINNGDDRTHYLIYSSSSNTEYRGCFFDGNIGITNFYCDNNNKRISFVGCYLQPKFGSLKNNALSFASEPIEKEEMEECISYILNQQREETNSCGISPNLSIFGIIHLALVFNLLCCAPNLERNSSSIISMILKSNSNSI